MTSMNENNSVFDDSSGESCLVCSSLTSRVRFAPVLKPFKPVVNQSPASVFLNWSVPVSSADAPVSSFGPLNADDASCGKKHHRGRGHGGVKSREDHQSRSGLRPGPLSSFRTTDCVLPWLRSEAGIKENVLTAHRGVIRQQAELGRHFVETLREHYFKGGGRANRQPIHNQQEQQQQQHISTETNDSISFLSCINSHMEDLELMCSTFAVKLGRLRRRTDVARRLFRRSVIEQGLVLSVSELNDRERGAKDLLKCSEASVDQGNSVSPSNRRRRKAQQLDQGDESTLMAVLRWPPHRFVDASTTALDDPRTTPSSLSRLQVFRVLVDWLLVQGLRDNKEQSDHLDCVSALTLTDRFLCSLVLNCQRRWQHRGGSLADHRRASAQLVDGGGQLIPLMGVRRADIEFALRASLLVATEEEQAAGMTSWRHTRSRLPDDKPAAAHHDEKTGVDSARRANRHQRLDRQEKPRDASSASVSPPIQQPVSSDVCNCVSWTPSIANPCAVSWSASELGHASNDSPVDPVGRERPVKEFDMHLVDVGGNTDWSLAHGTGERAVGQPTGLVVVLNNHAPDFLTCRAPAFLLRAVAQWPAARHLLVLLRACDASGFEFLRCADELLSGLGVGLFQCGISDIRLQLVDGSTGGGTRAGLQWLFNLTSG